MIDTQKENGIVSEKPNGENPSKQDLAEARTDWALERTLLANERNFSAWFRTGIAALAAGLGISKLLGDLGRPMVTKTIGVLFLASAALVAIAAFRRYYEMYTLLKLEDVAVTPLWVMGLLVIILLGTVALGLVLLVYAP